MACPPRRCAQAYEATAWSAPASERPRHHCRRRSGHRRSLLAAFESSEACGGTMIPCPHRAPQSKPDQQGIRACRRPVHGYVLIGEVGAGRGRSPDMQDVALQCGQHGGQFGRVRHALQQGDQCRLQQRPQRHEHGWTRAACARNLSPSASVCANGCCHVVLTTTDLDVERRVARDCSCQKVDHVARGR